MNSKYNRFIVVDSYGHGIFGFHDVTRVYYGNDPVRGFKKTVKFAETVDFECVLTFYDLSTGWHTDIDTSDVSALVNRYHERHSI